MKLFVALSALLAVAVAAPSHAVFYNAAPVVAAPVVTAPLISQYHAQDELGQYSYGYNGGLSAKAETKSLDGVTRGSYSYVDADGKLQTVSYSADALHGFRVAATNLPVGPVDTNEAPVAPVYDGVAPEPVQDTAEVVAARAEHLKAVEEVKVRNAAAGESEDEEAEAEVEAPVEAPVEAQDAPEVELPVAPVFDGVAPEPVQDTPEVAAAKEEHFKAVELAKERNALVENEPEYVDYVKTVPIAAPFAHQYAAHPGFRYAYAEQPAVYVGPQVDLKTTEVPASTAHVTYSAPVVQVKTVEAPTVYSAPVASYAYNYGAYPYNYGAYPYNYGYPYATFPYKK